MKKSWQTSEFWTMLVSNGVGIAVLFGLINAAEGEEIGNALKAIAGAVITIATTLGYMKSRVDVKKARLESLGDYSVGHGKDATTDDTIKNRDHMVAAIKKIGV